MNGFSPYAKRLSDVELRSEVARMQSRWWDYGNPADDKHYLYVALLEESRYRAGKPHVTTK